MLGHWLFALSVKLKALNMRLLIAANAMQIHSHGMKSLSQALSLAPFATFCSGMGMNF